MRNRISDVGVEKATHPQGGLKQQLSAPDARARAVEKATHPQGGLKPKTHPR